MSEWPRYTWGLDGAGIISTGTPHCLAGDATRIGRQTGASAAWPTANQARYAHFTVDEPLQVVGMWTFNGATAAGVSHVGIYREDYTLLVTANATQAGVSTVQAIDTLADTWLEPGGYFMALQNTLATATYFRCATASLTLTAAGVFQQNVGAAGLPATMVPAGLSTAFLPVFGLAFRTGI